VDQQGLDARPGGEDLGARRAACGGIASVRRRDVATDLADDA
jgi:hypothetical protein